VRFISAGAKGGDVSRPRDGDRSLRRRRLLGAAATGALGALAGCSGGAADGSAGGGSGGEPPDETDLYGGWFGGANGYDGTVDRTGRGTADVTVGADGGLAFVPAAVRVDAGTTVRWEWTGRGGQHNVVSAGGAFDYRSDLTDSPGFTFEWTFDGPGVSKYYCEPHRQLGMVGAVHVVEPAD
jgi:halocyanin-like protein